MPRKRRGRNEGAIYQRADGLWTASISLGYSSEGRRKRKVVYGASKVDVQRKLQELAMASSQGLLGGSSSITVGQYLKRWLETKKPNVAKNTYIPYERDCNRFLIPHLGPLKLAKLTALHIESLYGALTAEGTSAAMQRKIGTTLRTAMQHAVHPLRLIAHNPAADVPKPRHKAKEMHVLEPQLVGCFLAAAKADRFFALWVLSIDSAARQGELFALNWSDIDFEANAVSITKNLEETKGVLEIKEVKTKKSRRRIALAPFTMETLAAHRQAMVAEGHYGVDKPVFCDSLGGWLRKSNVLRRSFRPIIERANNQLSDTAKKSGLQLEQLPKLRPYDLRHTGATLLLLAGESPKVVSERLGHSTTSQTMDTYSHVLPGMQERAAAKMEIFLRK